MTNEQKKVGWIARVGQTAKEDVWEGQTTRVGELSANNHFYSPENMVCRQLTYFLDIFISCPAFSSYPANLLLFILSQ